MEEFINLLDDNEKERLSKYSSVFSSKEEYKEKEDSIYGEYDDKKRIKIELNRINKKLSEDSGLFYKYYYYSDNIAHDIPLIKIAEKVYIPTIKSKIVALDLALGLHIGLYSGIPILIEKMEGVKDYGKTIWNNFRIWKYIR